MIQLRDALRHGREAAEDDAPASVRLDGAELAMWGLMRLAMRTERSMPPVRNRGLPGRSAWPEHPDEITWWSMVRAAINGEIDMADTAEREPRIPPTAREVDLHEATFRFVQRHALRGKGARLRLLKALWAYASGRPPRWVRAEFGVSKWALYRARKEAMRDCVGQL